MVDGPEREPMQPPQDPKPSRGHRRLLLPLWTGALLGAFLFHYTFHWYHAARWPWPLYCPLVALVPFGIAWGLGVFLWKFWQSWQRPLPAWQKLLLTLAILAVAVPVLGYTGFAWVLTHLAP